MAEIGPDMSGFPTAAQLASWAGCCSGQRESAGRKDFARRYQVDGLVLEFLHLYIKTYSAALRPYATETGGAAKPFQIVAG